MATARWLLLLLTPLLGVGCIRPSISEHGNGTESSSSGVSATSSGSGTSSASSSAGATQTSAGSATGTGSTSGAASSSSAGSSAGSTTGTATLPPIVDGGYVFCDWPGSPLGEATWECHPGSYFCILEGDAGDCAQCLSDSDCGNLALPTYDPKRPFCDLTSGVTGFQNFCQECAQNADCTGNRKGPVCNTAVAPGLVAFPIDILNFDSCDGAVTNCSLPYAPACALNQTCNRVSGICTNRPTSCFSDGDCMGYFASQNQPAPHCFQGSCSACEQTTCTTSCSSDRDCADAGLQCLQPPTGPTFCGLSCAAPEAPACPFRQPHCEQDSGFCQACASDDDCTESTAPNCAPSGNCACTRDDQCPEGMVCFPRGTFGSCSIPVSGCTPETCGGEFCDWQTGKCVNPNDPTPPPECFNDYDCSTYFTEDFCVAGVCVGCRTNNDCLVTTYDPADFPLARCCVQGEPGCDDGTETPVNICVPTCLSNVDCFGSSNGPFCAFMPDAGYGHCQKFACATQADCAANPWGPVCDFDGGLPELEPYGTCDCRTTSDCGPGLACTRDGGLNSPTQCSTFCTSTADCPSGYLCDPGHSCRARCDDGGGICPAESPACDVENREGWNGETLDGSVPGLEWCYGCVTSNDCPDGQGCDLYGTHQCLACQYDYECVSGACLAGVCLTGCDAGACPSGQVCDTLGLAFRTPNFCVGCVGPADCLGEQGCNSQTHRCGSCSSQARGGGSFDCPPGDFCSSYWGLGSQNGACLQTCDVRPCPADRPICAQLLQLSNEHSFCFGCLSDADCANAGPGAWCDTSVNLTFTCQLPLAH